MKKILFLAMLATFANATSVLAYDPGQASGYDASTQLSQKFFKPDNTASQVEKRMASDTNSTKMQRSLSQPAVREEQREKSAFGKQQRPLANPRNRQQ